MISPAARAALELWCELHPDTTYTPDPAQMRLPLDEEEPNDD